MKHLKFNFAVVIALLAIGGTLGTHAKVFKKTKASPALFADCFSKVKYVSPPASCIIENLVINQTACEWAEAQIGKAMYGDSFDLIDPDACGVPGNVFCCAKIIVGPQTCSLPMVRFPNGSFNYAAIDQIFCKVQSSPSN